MTRRAAKLNEIRKQYSNVLVLDAGDSLTGDLPLAQETEGRTSVEAMNRLGYNAMALGLGDLSLGLKALQERMKEAKFPFLSANLSVGQSKELLGQPYVIREIAGHKVGIIGLTEAGNIVGFSVADPLATAKSIVPQVSRQADIVILLTHTPVSVARKIADEVPGIDLIVTGGDESLAAGEVTKSGALLVHADTATPGHAGRNLGIIMADFDSHGKLIKQASSVISLAEGLPEDPDMVAWVQEVTQPK